MKSFKRALSVGMLAFGLAAVSADAYATPVCLLAEYPIVLEIGQAGGPGSPILLGGYEVGLGRKLPLVGSLSINENGSVTLGWTTHFDWGSGDWICPVADTVLKTGTGSILYDITYHGGEPTEDPLGCPNNYTGTVQVISCEGYYPLLAGSPAEAAAGKNNR